MFGMVIFLFAFCTVSEGQQKAVAQEVVQKVQEAAKSLSQSGRGRPCTIRQERKPIRSARPCGRSWQFLFYAPERSGNHGKGGNRSPNYRAADQRRAETVDDSDLDRSGSCMDRRYRSLCERSDKTLDSQTPLPGIRTLPLLAIS